MQIRIVISMLFSLLSISPNVFAQQKFEKESRVKLDRIPVIAQQYIQSIDSTAKVKWFYEQNFTGNSYEAKFKMDKHKYSIEFDTLGKLEDVEIKYKSSELDPVVLAKMKEELTLRFQNFRIRKIQLQYSGDPELILKLIKSDLNSNSITKKYELIVKARKERRSRLYEVIFSSDLSIELISEIVFKNSDHLEY